jgi:hypothetical protein
MCEHYPVLLHLLTVASNRQLVYITQTVLNSTTHSKDFNIFQGKYMSNSISRLYSILLLIPKISTSFKGSIWATVFSWCFSNLWKLNPAIAQVELLKDMANKKFALSIQPHIFLYSYNKSQWDVLFLNFILLSIITNLNTVFTAIGICHTSYADCLLARSGWPR